MLSPCNWATLIPSADTVFSDLKPCSVFRFIVSKSFTIIIYLKIESYIQLKTHNVSMPLVHLIHVTPEMTKWLQYIYNKGLINYIKTLFKS